MIYDNDNWKDFIPVLKKVALNLQWREEYNDVINFLSSLDEDTANYIIDLLCDFFNVGMEYNMEVARRPYLTWGWNYDILKE